MSNYHVPPNERTAVNMAARYTRDMIHNVQWVAGECGVNPRALIVSSVVSTLQELRLLDDLKKYLLKEGQET